MSYVCYIMTGPSSHSRQFFITNIMHAYIREQAWWDMADADDVEDAFHEWQYVYMTIDVLYMYIAQ